MKMLSQLEKALGEACVAALPESFVVVMWYTHRVDEPTESGIIDIFHNHEEAIQWLDSKVPKEKVHDTKKSGRQWVCYERSRDEVGEFLSPIYYMDGEWFGLIDVNIEEIHLREMTSRELKKILERNLVYKFSF